jgi:la-related protein 1
MDHNTVDEEKECVKDSKTIRYTLVEAEEDNVANHFNIPQENNVDNSRRGRKPITWRRLDLNEVPLPPQEFRGLGRGRAGRFGRGIRGRGRSIRPRVPRLFISKYANMQPSNSIFTPPPSQDMLDYYASMAAAQVEFYFSTENLARDSFLRSYMDCEGYVPMAFVCNFPGVACYGCELHTIYKWLRTSHLLEMDENNETIRLREGWEVWLYPNPTDGGRGVPKWTKVVEISTNEINEPNEDFPCFEGNVDSKLNHTCTEQERTISPKDTNECIDSIQEPMQRLDVNKL